MPTGLFVIEWDVFLQKVDNEKRRVVQCKCTAFRNVHLRCMSPVPHGVRPGCTGLLLGEH